MNWESLYVVGVDPIFTHFMFKEIQVLLKLSPVPLAVTLFSHHLFPSLFQPPHYAITHTPKINKIADIQYSLDKNLYDLVCTQFSNNYQGPSQQDPALL